MSRLRKMQKHMMYPQLCDELLVEIFTRLPPKSLLRFRSLSKSWYSCIGSPDFIRMHTLRSREKVLIRHRAYSEDEEGEYEGFYTLHPQDQLPFRGYIGSTPVQFPSTYAIIVGSCNGIVCLLDYNENRISLWNPSIRRILTVPECPRYSKEIAFGLDPVTDDYKIVSIPKCSRRHVENSYVYASKTDTWCVIVSPMPLFDSVVTKACFVNGVLYWQVKNKADEYLLTFSLSTHVFGSIKLPEAAWGTIAPTSIGGSLAVISRDCTFDYLIWVRRDASWSVVYKLRKSLTYGNLSNVLQLRTNGDLVFDICAYGFHAYIAKTGACSGLVEFNAASFSLDIVECSETLQMLHMGTACEENKPSFLFKKKKKKSVNVGMSKRTGPELNRNRNRNLPISVQFRFLPVPRMIIRK